MKRPTATIMVYYFSSNTVSPAAFIYVGKDKVESAFGPSVFLSLFLRILLVRVNFSSPCLLSQGFRVLICFFLAFLALRSSSYHPPRSTPGLCDALFKIVRGEPDANFVAAAA